MQSSVELRGRGEPERFLTIDPGTKTGILLWDHGVWTTSTISLDELPATLVRYNLVGWDWDFVAVEGFSLTGGNRRNDPSMPAPTGIGMARMACHAAGIPLFRVNRTAKRAGHMALDADGLCAWQRARNDHERDAVDLGGYVLRESRLPMKG